MMIRLPFMRPKRRDFSIARLTSEDTPDIARLHREDFVRPWTDDEFTALLSQDTVFGFTVLETGRASAGPAGFVLARHAHDCFRFEVVVQGTLDVGERILKAGDVMLTEPGVAYGPHVAGPEGCTTFEFFTNYRSSHTTLIDGADGLVECDITTAEGLQTMQELMQRAAMALTPR